MTTLRRTLTEPQPLQSPFEDANGKTTTLPFDLGDAIHCAVAAALLDVPQEPRDQIALLSVLLGHDDPDTVALGVRRWGPAVDESLLLLASKDSRGVVASTAADVLAARGK